jgi:creatinine amidohydrolase
VTVRIFDMNWMAVEEYLSSDDRIVLPLGSTEQHGYLSLGVDSILSERVSVEAAEPLGVPVLPALAYGLTPYFAAYPGSPSMRLDTYIAVVRDLLDSLAGQGFRRILVVNGHGGNSPAASVAPGWMAANRGYQVLFHNWWSGPRTWATAQRIDSDASHASWMENFPWTRLPDVRVPDERKPMVDGDRLRVADPAGVRSLLGDGSYGGLYQRADNDTDELWRAGVEEVRDLLRGGWREV